MSQKNEVFSLAEGIKKIYRLEDKDLDLLLRAFVFCEVKDKTMLIKQGQISDYLYFISEGCMRSYYLAESKDVTLWFGYEGDFITCFRSWILRVPGHENIQLNQDCKLYRISYADLISLAENSSEINHFYRKILEDGFIYWENRTIMHLFKTARERYDHLLHRYPMVIQRWPLNHIASYLGVTQETLSRLRAKK